MPTIPGVYEQRTRAQGASLGVGPTGDAGMLLQGVGDVLERRQEFVKRKEEEKAAVAAQEGLNTSRTDTITAFQKRQQESAEDGEGFTEGVLADFDERARTAAESATTEASRNWIRQRLAEDRMRLYEEAIGYEAGKRVTYKTTGLQRSIDQTRTLVEFRPDDFPVLMAEQREAILASGLSPERQSALTQDALDNLSTAAVAGMVRRDARATLAEINNENSSVAAVRALPFESRFRLRGAAETEIRRQEAEARAARAEAQDLLRADLADAHAARMAGLPAELPSRARFAAAYGAEGAKRFADEVESWAVYDVVAQAAHQAPAEAAATLETLAPKGQEGAAADAQRYQSAVRMWNSQRKQLEDDPVGVLLSRDSDLRARAESAEGHDQVGEYLRTVRAKQEALGVETPRLLPNALRDRIASQLVFDPEKPRARAEMLQGIRDAYGRNFPQIIAEVTPKLEGTARVLVNMTPEDGQRLDAALAQDPEKVKKLLPSGASTDIDEALDRALEPFALTLTDNPDAEGRLVEHRAAAQALAQSLVLRGTSPNDAAEQAASAVINGRYEYRDTMRVPVEYDADAIASAASSRLADVAGMTLAISPGVHSDAQAAQADIREHVRKHGYWITNEDESGLVLRIPHRRGQGEVYDKDGQRIEYTWDDLLATAPRVPLITTAK
jgi:hypothetical protein